MAGESLNRPDESKLSSVRFLLSPFGLASPALRPAALSAATGRCWMRKSGAAGSNSWVEQPSGIKSTDNKRLLLGEKLANVMSLMRGLFARKCNHHHMLHSPSSVTFSSRRSLWVSTFFQQSPPATPDSIVPPRLPPSFPIHTQKAARKSGRLFFMPL